MVGFFNLAIAWMLVWRSSGNASKSIILSEFVNLEVFRVKQATSCIF